MSVSDSLYAQATAIHAGTLIDPETGTATHNQTILIEAGRITQVGDVAISDDVSLIDLSDAVVLPGLFDCHTHVCIEVGKPAGETIRDFYAGFLLTTTIESTAYRAIQGVANARSLLEAGFTTIRDLGNAGLYADTALRRAVEQGVVPGPTIVNAGRIIAPTGGQFPSHNPQWIQELLGLGPDEFIGVINPENPRVGEPEYFYADTHDELRKAVRENVLYGSRVIKIVVADQPYAYSISDIQVIVDEAAHAGRKVAAHCIADTGVRNAILGGVASVEHGTLMSDETLRLAKEHGTVLVGTDFPEVAIEQMGMPHILYERILDRLQRAHAIGVTMAFGTDAFVSPPGFTRGSLSAAFTEVYKEAGIPPAYVLQMLTTNAARLLGVEDIRGSISPGKAADIIATRTNPLDDILAVKDVFFVMKDGVVVRHDR
jgi:imidazolonepropionase-like amidohydrolase